jgi:hypothetical protein
MDNEDLAYVLSKFGKITFREELQEVEKVKDFDFNKFLNYSEEQQTIVTKILFGILED